MKDLPFLVQLLHRLDAYLNQRPLLTPESLDAAWKTFNASVGGRVHASTGLDGPCAPYAATIKEASSGRIRFSHCEARAAHGGKKSFYVEVHSTDDVIKTMDFVQYTGAPLSVENFYTDFCSSPAESSLALSFQGMDEVSYHRAFQPSSCPSQPHTAALSFQPGASASTIHKVADKHGVMVVAGLSPPVLSHKSSILSDATSILAPAYGSLIDNILEVQLVTPDGKLQVVNACSEKDLWFAVRGGGLNTFGVVTQITLKAHPKARLTSLTTRFSPNSDEAKNALSVLASHASEFAKAGWGGIVTPSYMLLTNPKAKAPSILEHFADLDVKTVRHDSMTAYLPFFEEWVGTAPPLGYALSSRLIPNESLSSPIGQYDVLKAIHTASTYIESWMVALNLPYDHATTTSSTSLSPAFHHSPWTIYFMEALRPGMSPQERILAHSKVAKATNFLRYLTPTGGVYPPHSDLSEVKPETAFWGENYPRLLKIKQDVDPKNVLQTWHSVGWEGQRSDYRYSCYTPAKLQEVRCDRWCR